MLPLICIRAFILTAVCLTAAGMIVFGAKMMENHDNAAGKLRIGYVAEDDMLTKLAVSYVQEMESVRSLCSLEPVTEQEGKRLLEKGELSGLIVLPKDVVNEILSGSNTPAKLYLSQGGGSAAGGGFRAVAAMLFEELASAGMGMLGTAQAEIYTAGAVIEELAAEYGTDRIMISGDVLQALYDDINSFNLEAVTGREALFLIKNLSLTGNDTYAVYYGSALLTVYVMLAGLFLGKFCRRTRLWQVMTARRIGIGYAGQLAAGCAAGGMLMFPVILLPFALLLIPQVSAILSVRLTAAGIVSLVFVTIFVTVYDMFLYEIVEKQESALVVIGVLAVFQAYLSGCLIPSVLLPKVITDIGALLPASFIRTAFTAVITGEAGQLYRVATGLMLWSLILSVLTVLSMRAGERSKVPVFRKKPSSGVRVPSLCMVMFRRLLHQKSIWLCMGLVAALSVGITRAEKASETQIKAAVYDGSGTFEALLEGYEGLVRFEIYDSGEQVRMAVLNGDAECGYILPKDLPEKMTARKANRSVTVYRDADAVAVPVVNEVIFERIFRRVSLRWFEDCLSGNSAIRETGADRTTLAEKTDSSFDRQLSAAFHVEIERTGAEDTPVTQDGNETAYPAFTVSVIAVILCALQGTVQVISDVRDRRFYKRNRIAVSLLTIVLPVVLGLFAALLTMGSGIFQSTAFVK